jgi:hypothetical protein
MIEDQERKGFHLVAAHIREVQSEMANVTSAFVKRMARHDQSKYSTQESALIQQKAILDSLPYNTPEYHESLTQIKSAVQAHYEVNSHHPEHYPNGVTGMSLLDMLEMISDWRVAAEMNGSELMESFDKCVGRFHISPDIRQVLLNTYVELGWIEENKHGN